jgi:hypothetical protein
VTLSLSLYLLLGGLCTVFCFATAASAAIRVPEHHRTHRLWAFLTGSLLPLAVAGTVLGTAMGYSILTPLGLLLPGLVLAGTWSNMITMRTQSMGVRLLHLPVVTFNTLLLGIYTLRLAQDLCGADLTVYGAAVTAGYGLMQHRVGQIGAESNPIWVHLPFLLPLAVRYHWPHKIVLAMSSALSCCLLAVLVAVMPFAYHRASSYWNAEPAMPELRAGFTIGVQMPWAIRIAPQSRRAMWQQQALELGVKSVSFVVRPDLFDDGELLRQVQEEISFARSYDLEVIAVAMPPAQIYLQPALDVARLGEAMAPLHGKLAETLSPDILVLYAGPFGQLVPFATRPGTIDDWLNVFYRSAAEVRRTNSSVRVAVSLESRAPHAQELFRRLKADDGPVDVVGLSVFPGKHTMEEIQAGMDMLTQWCESVPGDKEVRVLEIGASPHADGGELGQWHFLQAALVFATRTRIVTGATIVALIDEDMSFGLLAADGRRRRSWSGLHELLNPSAKPPR